MAKTAAAAFAGLKLGEQVKDAVTLAARYDQLGIVMSRVGENTGRSAVELAALDQQLQAAGISAIQSRNNIIKMMSANIDLAQATKLARLAQDAAVVGNLNSSESFERLIKGIQSAEKETLETLGLNVNFQRSYEKLAAQLGKNADQLTVTEKVQAGVNAAMEAGKNIAGAYADSLDNPLKKLQSTSRLVENLKKDLGEGAMPAFGVAVDAYSDSLKLLSENLGTVSQVLETGFYAALGRTAGALTQKAIASALATKASIAEAKADADSARQSALTAQAKQLEAKSVVELASLEVSAAQGKVASDRARQQSNLANLQSVQATLAAEMGLEQQRLKAQITEQGRAASVARMAEIRLSETAIIRQIQAAEAALAATTVAASAEVQAAYARRTAAVAAHAEATAIANAAVAASTKAAADASVAANTFARAGTGLLGVMGGPLGLAVTAGAVAASFIDWGGSAQKATIGLDDMQRSVVDLRAEFQSLKRDQQEAALVAWQEKQIAAADAVTARFDVLRQSLRDALVAPGDARSGGYAQQLQQYQQLIDRLNEAKASGADLSPILREVADRFNVPAAALDSWISQAGAISKASDESQEAAKRLGALTDAMRENTAAVRENNLANVETDEAGNKYLAQLQRQADFAGKLTEVQRVNIAIEKGYAGVLSESDKALALKNAALIDQANALKGSIKLTNDSANAYQALYDRLYPAEAAQRRYTKEVELLEAKLKGDQLADAIHRLNFAMEGADATGPADAIEEYRKELEALEDKINPAGKAAKDFAAEQKRLREEIERTGDPTGKWTALLQENERQFEQNTRATSEWAKWTEGALDRVDAAFADAWRNIGDGFSSFRDSLTNAFKQMLAELAHMAITKPIIMQIGAAMGIGGGAGQAVSMMGGSAGSGGLDAFGLLRNGYSIANSGFGQAVAQGWGNGGFSGAISSGWNYGSNALGGFFGSGAANSGGSAIADYTGAQFGNWVGAQNAAATTWGSAATGMGAIAGGLSGAYMGYQRSGIKGAVAGGVGGWGGGTLGTMAGAAAASALSGTAMGAALGSVLPGIGTVIGAALGAAFGSKLFGGDWETKDAGLAFSVTDGDFLGQQFEYQKKKGGLFSSDKKRTRFSALDEETAAQFQAAFDATEDTVSDLLARIGVSVNAGALDGLEIARRQISTKGKTEEEIQAAIAEWFEFAGDRMIAEIDKGVGGFGYSLEELTRRINVFEGVNDSLELINVAVLDLSAHSMELANGIAEAAGGMDALSANVATYYGAFFSAAEQQEKTLQQLLETFDDAGITIAKSRSEYRGMVEAIDVTTESGSELFNTLMALSGQAAQYYSILEQQGAALIGAAGSAYAALQRSIANQQQEIQRAASSTASAINALTGVSNSLDAALKRLRGSSDDTVRMLRAQAVMTLNSALVTARAGGSLADYAGLQDALDVASNMDTSLYRSLEDFEREQGRTANLIAELEKVNGKQLSAEEQMLEQYEKQLSKLDEQLAFAQSQLDALNGIDNSIMSVAAAIAAMNASVVAALQGLPKGAAQANTPQNNRSIIDTIYQSVLGRGTEGDEAGAAFWANALQSGKATYQDIAASIAKGALGNSAESAATKKSAEEYLKGLGIPGFASGGLFGGGLRIVGEKGPELEVTGPSRIYNAGQTAAMLSGAGSTEELRALRSEVAGLRSALGAIAKYTESTAYGVRQMNEIGLPQPEAA